MCRPGRVAVPKPGRAVMSKLGLIAMPKRSACRCVAVLAAILPLFAALVAPQASPRRVVSLVPGATEVLFAIGAGELVAGVSSFDHWPPEVELLPRVGGLIDPDLEAILALRPDLAIIDPSQGSLRRQLGLSGIAVYEYATADVADLLRNMRDLGGVLGVSDRAARFAERVNTELVAVRDMYSSAPPLRVLMVFGRRDGSFAELWVNGGVGFLQELTAIAGGRNVFDDVARPGFKAGLEAVLARVPDVVVELRSDGQSGIPAATLEAEWRTLPGFAEVRVVTLAAGWMLVPGPRVAEAARVLGTRLHGR